MKKLFAIIAMFGVFAFGATQAMMAQTDEAAAAESDSAATMVDSAAVDSAAVDTAAGCYRRNRCTGRRRKLPQGIEDEVYRR